VGAQVKKGAANTYLSLASEDGVHVLGPGAQESFEAKTKNQWKALAQLMADSVEEGAERVITTMTDGLVSMYNERIDNLEKKQKVMKEKRQRMNHEQIKEEVAKTAKQRILCGGLVAELDSLLRISSKGLDEHLAGRQVTVELHAEQQEPKKLRSMGAVNIAPVAVGSALNAIRKQ
jgi:hypothetical protein